MRSKQPPRIATWMLKHFGSGPNNDALLGDLAEQYPQKDSAMWYWRQAMKAIPVSFFKEIRGHKRIAARALVTGWIMWILGGISIFRLAFFGTNVGYAFKPRHPIGTAWSFMWMPVLGQASLTRPFYPFVFAVAVALPLMVVLMDLLLFGPFIFTVEPSVAYFFVGPLAANVAASVLGILLGGGLLRNKSGRQALLF